MNMVVPLVPGKLTWLLQMLDVKVFGVFKRQLRQACMSARNSSPSGQCSPVTWIPLAVDAVDALLTRRMWTQAFDVMRIPCDDIASSSCKKVRRFSPAAVENLLPMPMTPLQTDQYVGRHRLGLTPLLFELPIRLMPEVDRLALHDRLANEEVSAAAALPDLIPAPSLVMSPPPPAIPIGDAIAVRVAQRHRGKRPPPS